MRQESKTDASNFWWRIFWLLSEILFFRTKMNKQKSDLAQKKAVSYVMHRMCQPVWFHIHQPEILFDCSRYFVHMAIPTELFLSSSVMKVRLIFLLTMPGRTQIKFLPTGFTRHRHAQMVIFQSYIYDSQGLKFKILSLPSTPANGLYKICDHFLPSVPHPGGGGRTFRGLLLPSQGCS